MTIISCAPQISWPPTPATTPAVRLGGALMPWPDPGELIVRTAGGDHVAFTGLCVQLWSGVFGLIHRLLRDVHQAEEVTQETFLQVWQQAHRFDPAAGSARAWVFTVARRRAIDRIRSAQATRVRDARYAASGHQIDGLDPAEQSVEDLSAVTRALVHLSAKQREAISMSFFGDLSHAEIAGILQIPVATVKTRIRDGLIKLRSALAGGPLGR